MSLFFDRDFYNWVIDAAWLIAPGAPVLRGPISTSGPANTMTCSCIAGGLRECFGGVSGVTSHTFPGHTEHFHILS